MAACYVSTSCRIKEPNKPDLCFRLAKKKAKEQKTKAPTEDEIVAQGLEENKENQKPLPTFYPAPDTIVGYGCRPSNPPQYPEDQKPKELGHASKELELQDE